jgi:hypothetical protein
VTAPGTTAGINAELEASGEITGKVTTGADEPVKDTYVCAKPVAGTKSGGCRATNTNGEYTIPGLETGTYVVEFNGTTCQEGHCDTYIAQYYSDAAMEGEAEHVEVTAPHATTGIDAVLIGAGEIAGHVYAEGHGEITETQVCAQRQAEGTELTEANEHCASTSAQGEYKIEGLPVGLYVVTFPGELCPNTECHPEFAPQFFDGATDRSEATEIDVTGATERGEVDAHLKVGGRISGTVTTDWLTPQPIDGGRVCAYKTPPNGLREPPCGSANTAGEYTIAGLQSGQYHVDFDGTVCPSIGPCEFGVYVAQFFNGEPEGSDEQHAAGVSVSAGQTTDAIDGELAETEPKRPANVQPPQLAGSATVGAILHCSDGQWSNNPTRLHYAWLRNTAPISGAASATYTVSSADQGASVACQVTASNGAGGASAASNAIAIPAAVVTTTTTTTTARQGTAVAVGTATVNNGTATVKLRCSSAGPCKGTLELTVAASARHAKRAAAHKPASKVVLASSAFSIPAGAAVTLRLKLTAEGRKLFAAAAKKGLRVTVGGRDVQTASLVLRLAQAAGPRRRRRG